MGIFGQICSSGEKQIKFWFELLDMPELGSAYWILPILCELVGGDGATAPQEGSCTQKIKIEEIS